VRGGGKILAALALSVMGGLAALGATTVSARADYRFCNATSYVLQGAIAVPKERPNLRGSNNDVVTNDPTKAETQTTPELAGAVSSGKSWEARGWTQILPGECDTALEGPVEKGDYYVFARSIDAHQGSTKFFAGNARFCTLPDNFTIDGRENCALRGYDSHDFIRVAVKAGSDWTTTFGEPRDYSLAQARIAGAQRLLKDNGLTLPKIDGYAAKNTQRAVMAFERAEGRAVTGSIDRDLVTALVDGASREQARVGLNICNKTKHLVWAAIAVGSTSDDDISSGWVRVAPESCAKAIKDKLIETPYYLYAEATDEKGSVVLRGGRRYVWAGQHAFCVKTTRFEIKGREACATRGYDERPFMKIETGGIAKFDVTLD
jgi:uncharacterized membrane protein